jgi:hypothetical protein
MKRSGKFKALTRAAGALIAALVVVSGVTFAVLQSQQIKLAGNTIQTATANLLLSSDGTNYSSSQSGYNFSNLVPGGSAMPASGYPIYLKNSGGTPVALKFAVSSTPSNPDNVDLSKVNVIIMPVNGGATQVFTLQALIAANTTGGLSINTPAQFLASDTMKYTIQVSLASDANIGSSASLGNIDFAFTGVAVTN